jgi:hypothetical protein
MARERENAGRSGREPITNARTTVGDENARREERVRFQRDHPDELAARGRDPQREDPPVDADDDSERFRARENENLSEG